MRARVCVCMLPCAARCGRCVTAARCTQRARFRSSACVSASASPHANVARLSRHHPSHDTFSASALSTLNARPRSQRRHCGAAASERQRARDHPFACREQRCELSLSCATPPPRRSRAACAASRPGASPARP
jgi:hypothetical protein